MDLPLEKKSSKLKTLALPILKTTLSKHSILVGIIISLLLLFIATCYYPGGSQYDKHSIGYNWKKNYLSNLFSENAVNGSHNGARFWAAAGMLFLCTSFALFFISFSKKIPVKNAARIIRYFGLGAMISSFLIVTPYHDVMVTIAGTLGLISIFYITVFVFKSRLLICKILSVACLLAFYCCNYLYYTSSYLSLLPIMQKLLLVTIIIWVLFLRYFSESSDFEPVKHE